MRWLRSRTTQSRPFCFRWYAVDRPACPAPMMTVSTWSMVPPGWPELFVWCGHARNRRAYAASGAMRICRRRAMGRNTHWRRAFLANSRTRRESTTYDDAALSGPSLTHHSRGNLVHAQEVCRRRREPRDPVLGAGRHRAFGRRRQRDLPQLHGAAPQVEARCRPVERPRPQERYAGNELLPQHEAVPDRDQQERSAGRGQGRHRLRIALSAAARLRRRSLGIVLAALAVATAGCAQVEQSSPPTGQVTGKPAPASATKHKAARAPVQTVTKTAQPVGRSRGTTSSPASAKPAAGTAAAQLARLVVAGRAPMTGYDRDRFGQAWLDADRNGCDTRNDMLRRDLRAITIKPGTNGCVVLAGVLEDPYTRTRIDFVRGDGYSVDVDHVVALGNAWASGAWRFDIKKRAALANDPLNLLAVDAGANRSKGDANAASWLPPNRTYRCAYVARQVAVKAKYHLRVTASERAQMARQLASCPGQAATPDLSHAPTRVDQNISDPGVASHTSGATPASHAASGSSGG